MRSLALFCLLAGSFKIAAQEPPTAPPLPSPPAGARVQQAPKNLKILKPEEVRPAMGLFRASLGVTCTACHVQGDFASDAKPEKETARKMILMTRQINANFPAGIETHEIGDRVSCYTCHNGASHPKTVPPAQPAAARPAPPPPPPPPAQ